jgi:hypothetical protein
MFPRQSSSQDIEQGAETNCIITVATALIAISKAHQSLFSAKCSPAGKSALSKAISMEYMRNKVFTGMHKEVAEENHRFVIDKSTFVNAASALNDKLEREKEIARVQNEFLRKIKRFTDETCKIKSDLQYPREHSQHLFNGCNASLWQLCFHYSQLPTAEFVSSAHQPQSTENDDPFSQSTVDETKDDPRIVEIYLQFLCRVSENRTDHLERNRYYSITFHNFVNFALDEMDSLLSRNSDMEQMIRPYMEREWRCFESIIALKNRSDASQ